MSDFVSRVAARAVGQAASAQPRLPALFEPSGPGGGGLEAVEEMVAPTPAASRSAASPAALEAGRALEHPVAAPPGLARPQPGRPAPATPARPRHRQGYSASDKLSPAAAGDGGAAAESFVEPTSAERGAVAPASPIAPVSAPSAAAAAAQPVARAAPVASPPPVARTAAAAEQRPVRVHIGRLEVRAALQEAPIPQRARERPRPQELSLGDYLRGRRSGS